MKTDLGSNVAAFRYLSGQGIRPSAVVEPLEASTHRKLRIHVLVTDVRTASTALKRAVELAIDLNAETRILLPQVVPNCPVIHSEGPRHALEVTGGT
jgi:hypothetical protein